MFRNKVGILGLVAALGLAACEDSSTSGDVNQLSDGEVAGLAQVIIYQALASQGISANEVDGPPVARAIVEYSQDINVTLPCPRGGSVMLDGSLDGTTDTETQAGVLNYSLTQTHMDCGVVTDEEGGVEIIVDGAPSMTSTLSMDQDGQGNGSLTGGIEGAFDWAAGDRSGSCSVDLQFSGESTPNGQAGGSLSGSICGLTISQSVNVS